MRLSRQLRFGGRQAGVVLPIVLVVMMVVTTLVLTQVRRGTVDERLAGNWSRAISGQTAAESLVRYCEARLFANNNDEARKWKQYANRPISENFVGTPAWDSNLNANQIITVEANLLPVGATAATCVVEDATSELQGGVYQLDQNPGAGISDPYLWKYRITATVIFADATLFGNVTYRAQSEVRFLIT
jgi:Tfp pilus assembly protein PilX